MGRIIMRLLAPLKRQVMLMVGRCVLKVINDGTTLQSLQINLLAGETRDDIERFQNYGFTSNPHPGAEGVTVFPGGNRSHGLVIAVDDRRYRLKGLEPGEIAMYTDEGDKIVFKRGNRIEIHTGTLVVEAATRIEFAGEGGPAVARIGDQVLVGAGSSAGLWPIVEGSPVVFSN